MWFLPSTTPRVSKNLVTLGELCGLMPAAVTVQHMCDASRDIQQSLHLLCIQSHKGSTLMPGLHDKEWPL